MVDFNARVGRGFAQVAERRQSPGRPSYHEVRGKNQERGPKVA
jgi:hypothetical protein